MEKVGIISIDSILGAGPVTTDPALLADTFIYMTAQHGTVTINACECEGFLRSMQVVGGPNLEANITWPILVINSTLGPDVLLNSNCDYISIANRYLPETVKCVDAGTDVMFYSMGDIFANNLATMPDPSADFQLLGNSRIASRANRYRVDFQRPARFGGRAGFITPTEQTTLPLAVSAFTNGEAQVSLCDEEGNALFYVRADGDFIYFEDPRTLPGTPPTKLMRLDNKGNLVIAGTLEENGTP